MKLYLNDINVYAAGRYRKGNYMKYTCSMQKRKESLAKKYEGTVDPDIKKYVDATDRARIMETLYSFCQEVYDTFKAELEKGTPSSDRYDEIMKEARKIYNKQFADIVEFQMVAAAARSATMAKN